MRLLGKTKLVMIMKKEIVSEGGKEKDTHKKSGSVTQWKLSSDDLAIHLFMKH